MIDEVTLLCLRCKCAQRVSFPLYGDAHYFPPAIDQNVNFYYPTRPIHRLTTVPTVVTAVQASLIDSIINSTVAILAAPDSANPKMGKEVQRGWSCGN